MKRYLPLAMTFAMITGPAFAQLIAGGGGGDWIATPLQTLLGVITFGLVEVAVAFYAGWALLGNHHSIGGMAAAAIAAVALAKYQTVAGWFAGGMGALGIGGL